MSRIQSMFASFPLPLFSPAVSHLSHSAIFLRMESIAAWSCPIFICQCCSGCSSRLAFLGGSLACLTRYETELITEEIVKNYDEAKDTKAAALLRMSLVFAIKCERTMCTTYSRSDTGTFGWAVWCSRSMSVEGSSTFQSSNPLLGPNIQQDVKLMSSCSRQSWPPPPSQSKAQPSRFLEDQSHQASKE